MSALSAPLHIDVILMDIEGTTTPIDFVHSTLFPYAKKHLPAFVRTQRENSVVQDCLDALREELQLPPQEEESIIATLLQWIDEDVKHPILKKLQGMVWEKGYFDGDFTAPMYEDVVPSWKAWKEQEKQLAIYSSGSVKAQQLLFQFSNEGDIRSYLSEYFDTSVGSKREVPSYVNIAQVLKVDPEKILFLSDIFQELDAARATKIQTIQLLRPGTQACDHHPTATSFEEIAKLVQ